MGTSFSAIKSLAVEHCLLAIKHNYIVDEFFNPKVQEWVDNQGKNLLHYAVLNHRPCIVACLLAAGFLAHAIDKEQNMPLHHALLHIQENSKQKIHYAIIEDIDPLIIQKFIKIVKKINPDYIFCITGHNDIVENSGDLIRILLQETKALHFFNTRGESSLCLLNDLLYRSIVEKKMIYQNYVRYALKSFSHESLKKILELAFMHQYKNLRDEIIQIFIQEHKDKKSFEHFIAQTSGSPSRSNQAVFHYDSNGMWYI
jgi:hypothetical protein